MGDSDEIRAIYGRAYNKVQFSADVYMADVRRLLRIGLTQIENWVSRVNSARSDIRQRALSRDHTIDLVIEVLRNETKCNWATTVRGKEGFFDCGLQLGHGHEVECVSEMAQRIVKIVDDEGYYDRETAGAEVDRYILRPVRECLEGLRMRKRPDGSPCWCLIGPSDVRVAAGHLEHTGACEDARSLYLKLATL